MNNKYDRRTVLETGGAALTAGIAGCLGGSDSGEQEEPNQTETPPENPTDTQDNTTEGPDQKDDPDGNGENNNQGKLSGDADILEILENIADNEVMYNAINEDLRTDESARYRTDRYVSFGGYIQKILESGVEGDGGLAWSYLDDLDRVKTEDIESSIKHPFGPRTVLFDLPGQEVENMLEDIGLEQEGTYEERQIYKGEISVEPANRPVDVVVAREGNMTDTAAEDIVGEYRSSIINDGEAAVKNVIDTRDGRVDSLPEGNRPDEKALRQIMEIVDKSDNEHITNATGYMVLLPYEETFQSDILYTDVKAEYGVSRYSPEKDGFHEEVFGVTPDDEVVRESGVH
jgi:hypothetical protein